MGPIVSVRALGSFAIVFAAVALQACAASEDSGGDTPGGTGGTSSGGSGASSGGSDASAGGSDASAGGAGGSATGGASGSGATGGATGGGAGQPADAAPDSACAPVSAAADVDPWAMRAKAAGFGGIETKSAGGHTDVFLKSPTDYIRLGVRLDWGGTVVFYGLSANAGSNVIDANDTGRELQLAIYDPTRSRQPCAWNASCLSSTASCGNSITFLGWNPVQGGDECNHGAKVLSHGQVGDALEVLVQPLQWNPDWDKQDCTQSACGANGVPVQVQYRSRFRFLTEHVVEVDSQVTSQESLSHPPTGQEFPTLYVANGQGGPDLPLLLDAAGTTITLSTPGNDGFFYGNFTSPGPWVSWQNAAKTYGVGLGMDQGSKKWQGWRGGPPSAPYFHNVRAEIVFGLPAGGTVRGISYLALGAFGTVKGELEGVFAKRPPFGTLDSPKAGTPPVAAGGSLAISGWVLDTAKIASVKVQVDGTDVATLPVGSDRPDVCSVYPGYDGCPKVGFAGSVPTAGLTPCPHLLRVIATDAEGNSQVLGERVFSVGS